MCIQNYLQNISKGQSIQVGLWKEVVMPLEFVVPNIQITIAMHMTYDQSLQRWLDELKELKEDRLNMRYHQLVQN